MSSFLINTRLNNLSRQLQNAAGNPALDDLDMNGKDIINAGTVNYTTLNPPVIENLQQVLTNGNNAGGLSMTNINNVSATSITTPTTNTNTIRNAAGQTFMTLDDTAGADGVTFTQNINLQGNSIYVSDAAGTLNFVRQGTLPGPAFNFVQMNTTTERFILIGDLQFSNARDCAMIIRSASSTGFTIQDNAAVVQMQFNTTAPSGGAGRRITMGTPIQGGGRFIQLVDVPISATTTIDFSNPTYYNTSLLNISATNAGPININFTNTGIQRMFEVRLNSMIGNITFTDISLTATAADVGKTIRFWVNGGGVIFQVKYFT